uniref:DOMON domain-containing protein n=1 Tax=Anopheles gambiae TaxID=7165 RepID=A0A1S4HCS6_ANOGA
MALGCDNACCWIFTLLLTSVTCYNISSERLHSLKLNHDSTKLTWMVDWPKKEVLFYINNTFDNGKFKTFAIGFSQRGELSRCDLCVFTSVPKLYQQVYDSYTSRKFDHIFRDTLQNCEVMYMDENSVAFQIRQLRYKPRVLPVSVSRTFICSFDQLCDNSFVEKSCERSRLCS